MKRSDLPFGNNRGKRCEGNCCKVRQTKNGQFSVTLPSSIAKDKNIQKGDKLKFSDEGVWIKIEYEIKEA